MPVAFASKTLTCAECNYANIEHELLGVLFGVLHFIHFTFSNEVNIITDHKPLVSLLKKSLAACSSRLSRLILKIVDYPLKMMYQPGRKMVISDTLSHLSTHQIPDTKETVPGLNVTIYYVPLIYGLVIMDQFLLKEVKCSKINKVVFASVTLYFSCIPT